MKRSLLFLCAFSLLSPGNVGAQNFSEKESLQFYPYFIPTAYTQEGRTVFYTVEGDFYHDFTRQEDGNFTIYDEDFKEIKKFSVPEEKYKSYTSVRRRAAVTDPFTGVVTYTGEWETTRENENEGRGYCCRPLGLCTEVDFGIAEAFDEQRLFLTQTLFNEDDKFEYLYETMEVKETAQYERDRDGDGVIDEVTTSYMAVESGLEIRQDDGTVLFRHDYVDMNNVMSTGVMLYRVGGKAYLVIQERGYMNRLEELHNSYTVYSIDSKTSKITELKRSSSVRAYPNPVRKGEMVTMELPDVGSRERQREVRVSSMEGRMLWQQRVGAGERAVQVPLGGVPAGVYHFTVVEDGKPVATERIVVR